MDSNSTKISYEEARNDAKTLDNCALKMRDEFDEFINHMNQLGAEDVFYGMASEQTKQSFAELRAPQVKHTLPLKFLWLQFRLCPPLQPVSPHLEHL